MHTKVSVYDHQAKRIVSNVLTHRHVAIAFRTVHYKPTLLQKTSECAN